MQACQGLRETSIPEEQVAGVSSSKLSEPEVGELDKFLLPVWASCDPHIVLMDIKVLYPRHYGHAFMMNVNVDLATMRVTPLF